MLPASSGERAIVSALAKDSLNLPLNYSWTATGGKIEQSGTIGALGRVGTRARNYTISARVDAGPSSVSGDVFGKRLGAVAAQQKRRRNKISSFVARYRGEDACFIPARLLPRTICGIPIRTNADCGQFHSGNRLSRRESLPISFKSSGARPIRVHIPEMVLPQNGTESATPLSPRIGGFAKCHRNLSPLEF